MAIAKEEAYAELYKRLDTVEGNKIIYKLAKTRNRRTKDICYNIFISDKEGKIQTDTTKIIEVWMAIEVWKLLGDEGVDYLLQTMNAVPVEGMPQSWRNSEISPLYKGKGSVLECGNYRGIKLMAHTMKF